MDDARVLDSEYVGVLPHAATWSLPVVRAHTPQRLYVWRG